MTIITIGVITSNLIIRPAQAPSSSKSPSWSSSSILAPPKQHWHVGGIQRHSLDDIRDLCLCASTDRICSIGNDRSPSHMSRHFNMRGNNLKLVVGEFEGFQALHTRILGPKTLQPCECARWQHTTTRGNHGQPLRCSVQRSVNLNFHGLAFRVTSSEHITVSPTGLAGGIAANVFEKPSRIRKVFENKPVKRTRYIKAKRYTFRTVSIVRQASLNKLYSVRSCFTSACKRMTSAPQRKNMKTAGHVRHATSMRKPRSSNIA